MTDRGSWSVRLVRPVDSTGGYRVDHGRLMAIIRVWVLEKATIRWAIIRLLAHESLHFPGKRRGESPCDHDQDTPE